MKKKNREDFETARKMNAKENLFLWISLKYIWVSDVFQYDYWKTSQHVIHMQLLV